VELGRAQEQVSRADGPDTPPNEGVRIHDVHFAYAARGRRPGGAALRGIELDIPPGQTVALLGPNGSGKSTLIKIVCGMFAPDAGSVEVFGARRPAAVRDRVSVVFQFDGLDRHLTVHENLRDQAALYGIPRREARARVDRELQRAGLTDRRRSLVKTLSRGLARRADLARAMLHRPRLLMLDEPTVGLDPVARETFLGQLLDRPDARAHVVLLSTHLVDEAQRCDRVVLLHEGRVIADDRPTALRERHAVAKSTVIQVAAREPPQIDGLAWLRAAGERFTAATDDLELLRSATARLVEAELEFSVAPPRAPTLAEVFEALTGAHLGEDGLGPEGAPDS
jgi:ABC-2 type transport system ATP-binding protein